MMMMKVMIWWQPWCRSAATLELPCHFSINLKTCPDDSSRIRSFVATKCGGGVCNPYPHLVSNSTPARSHMAPAFCNNQCSPHVAASILEALYFPSNFQITYVFHSKLFYSVNWYPSSRWLVSVAGSCHSAQDSSHQQFDLISPLTRSEPYMYTKLHPWWLKDTWKLESMWIYATIGARHMWWHQFFWSIHTPPTPLFQICFHYNPTKWAGLSVLKDNVTYAQDSQPRIELKFDPWWHGDYGLRWFPWFVIRPRNLCWDQKIWATCKLLIMQQ